jgi:hypothetical protein
MPENTKPKVRPCPQGAWDVFSICCEAERRHFAADGPDLDERHLVIVSAPELFLGVIKRIRYVLATKGLVPAELIDIEPANEHVDPRQAALHLLDAARQLPPQAWILAFKERDLLTDPEAIELRAKALTIARLWFTRAIKNRVRPVAIKITGGPEWRL